MPPKGTKTCSCKSHDKYNAVNSEKITVSRIQGKKVRKGAITFLIENGDLADFIMSQKNYLATLVLGPASFYNSFQSLNAILYVPPFLQRSETDAPGCLFWYLQWHLPFLTVESLILSCH